MNTAESDQSSFLGKNKPVLWIALSLILAFGMWFAQSPIAGASDVRVHVRSAHVYFAGLVDSLNLPDWDATAYGGRGTPMIRYIGQLPLLLASFFQLLGADPALSIKLTVVLFAMFGLVGLHRLLAATGLEKVFSICAIFFVAQPAAAFHYGVTLIFQNICAHFLSSWLWLSAFRIWQGKRHALLSGAIAMSIIAWTHLLYVLMVGYLWVIFMLVSWLRWRGSRFAAAVLVVPVMAIALTAPYILPVVFTKDDVHYEKAAHMFQPGKPYCEFLDEPIPDKNNRTMPFLGSLKLIVTVPDIGRPLPKNVTSLQIMSSPQRNEAMRPWLLLTVLTTLLTAIIGIVKPARTLEPVAMATSEWLGPGLFGAFMTLSISKALHYVLPGGTDVQFPFRWVLPATGVLMPLIAIAVHSEPAEKAAQRFISIAARMGVFILLAAGLMVQTQLWTLPQSSLNDFFTNPGHLQPFYPRAVPDPNAIPTQAGEPHQLALISGEAEVLDYQAGITLMKCRLKASATVELNILTHYDKYWQLTASSQLIELKPTFDDGTLLAMLPAGEWHLELTRRAPDGRNTGWLIMIATLMLMFRQYRSKNSDS